VGVRWLRTSSRLTRRPPSPAAAPRGPPCHSYRPGRFPSSRQWPQPLRSHPPALQWPPQDC
jgi:hypothetical protein